LEYDLGLNPDIFSPNEVVGDDATLENDKALVRDLNEFMHATLLPGLVSDIYLYGAVPLHGESLTEMMHRRGINMRYLSTLIKVAEELDVKTGKTRSGMIQNLCVHEMIARAAKHLLRTMLKDMPTFLMPSCIAYFLNCLVGVNAKASWPAQQTVRRLYGMLMFSDYAGVC
jgi:protein TIF31